MAPTDRSAVATVSRRVRGHRHFLSMQRPAVRSAGTRGREHDLRVKWQERIDEQVQRNRDRRE
jgi:hypothetical protein